MAVPLPNDDETGEMSEINVTPLVDVMLVLLVVFIVTAPLLTQAVRVKLPETEQTEPAPDQHITILSVDSEGHPSIDDKPVALEALEEDLKALIEQNPDVNLQLQADRTTIFESVARVMAIAQRSGIGKLSFVTLQR
ncbi:MAG: ExbD/TolR family protein [Methylococcales bacterium]